MKRYPLLDPIRLVLALGVMFRHLLGWQVFPSVPAFLAISGFLVLQSFDNDPSWKSYAWKRFLRVYPALAAMFIFALLLAGPTRTWEMFLYYIKFGFGSNKNWNDPLWTLPFEEVFYVLLVVLYLTGAYGRRWIVWAGAGVGLCIATYGLLFTVPYPDSLPRALPFVWLFFVGNLFYLYREWFFGFRYLGFPILALAIGVHLYGIVIGNSIHLDCLASVLTAPGILLIGTQFVPKLPRMPDFSYSCYIWHYLIGSWCISVGLSKWMLIPFLAIACAGSWYLIEKPSRKWRHRRPQLAFWKTPEPAEVAV